MIKVASYNMHKGIGADRRCNPERIVDVLREIDADIIALQEADRRFGTRERVIPLHLLDEQTDWKPVAVGRRVASMGWHGNAILVRKAAEVTACDAIHLPALEPRGAVTADIRLAGSSIRVVGMHLDLSGLWRRKQAGAIIAHLAHRSPSCPTVMMGDLNEWTTAAGAYAISAGISASPRPARPSMPAARSAGSTGSWPPPISKSSIAASMPARRRARRPTICRSGRYWNRPGDSETVMRS